LIAGEQRIPGTPLVLSMEVPRHVVISEATATVRRLIAFSVLLTIAGAIVAWWAGRRVARPLVDLTNAAESIARGDYAARVPVLGAEEVARLATSFNAMAAQVGESRAQSSAAQEAAETANRAKSDFLAAMSHELRTPLNAIGGYTELMEMGLRGPVTAEQKKDLMRIRNSQQHLLGLVGRILDLSRIERGEVEYERASIAIDPLLIGLEDLVFPQAHAKQQTLNYNAEEPDLVVIADREKLRQIVINLLSNAIRHSPSGSSISIGARRATPSLIGIVVADSGPGIARDQQEAIFEPFVQLDRSLTSSVEGVGLGLAISRDLARGMGGNLTVESEPGKGARFTLTLPAGVLDGDTQMARTIETTAIHRTKA
jgi:signal transduction histidine kinase